MATITPTEKFAHIIEITLEAYAQDVWSITQETIDTIGREAAKVVSANAKRVLDHPHNYPKGWTYTAQRPKTHHALEKTGVVHNKTEYRLAHLLERSHVMRNGTGRSFGPSKARPHIAEVEEMVTEKFEREIMRAIQ